MPLRAFGGPVNYTPTEEEDSHSCYGHCGRSVARHLFTCRACWRRLPMELQTPILTSRWAGDWPAHSRALTDAIAWYTVDAGDRKAAALTTAYRGRS